MKYKDFKTLNFPTAVEVFQRTGMNKCQLIVVKKRPVWGWLLPKVNVYRGSVWAQSRNYIELYTPAENGMIWTLDRNAYGPEKAKYYGLDRYWLLRY